MVTVLWKGGSLFLPLLLPPPLSLTLGSFTADKDLDGYCCFWRLVSMGTSTSIHLCPHPMEHSSLSKRPVIQAEQWYRLSDVKRPNSQQSMMGHWLIRKKSVTSDAPGPILPHPSPPLHRACSVQYKLYSEDSLMGPVQYSPFNFGLGFFFCPPWERIEEFKEASVSHK